MARSDGPCGGAAGRVESRSRYQIRAPVSKAVPGRVSPGEMLAHAGLQDDVSVSTIGRCVKSTVRMYPEMTGT